MYLLRHGAAFDFVGTNLKRHANGVSFFYVDGGTLVRRLITNFSLGDDVTEQEFRQWKSPEFLCCFASLATTYISFSSFVQHFNRKFVLTYRLPM
jgi:hypothetical protein